MLNYILDLSHKIFSEKNELTAKEKELVNNEISHALNLTRTHINSYRINSVDISSSILATVWLRASINLSTINHPNIKELISTMREKGKYWSDPEKYDKVQFDKYNMRISDVEKTIKSLGL